MNDPVLEFLVGWVMEFGTRPVPGSERRTNKWYKTYINQHHRNAFSNDRKRYFTGSSTNNIPVQITQAGLDYIANGGAVEGLDYIGQRQMSESRQEPVGGEG